MRTADASASVERNGRRAPTWTARCSSRAREWKSQRSGARRRSSTSRRSGVIALIVLLAVAVLVLVVLARTFRIVPQARAGVVERLGRYSRTLNPGLTI